jgi:outer membrane protein assembly factor BamD (BamD/ComL family)
MKKDELRYDPVHDRIAAIIEYIDNNKNITIQVLLIIGLSIGIWGYYSGLQKDMAKTAKSLIGVAQNTYNTGQIDLALTNLNDIVEEYSGTDAGNQALIYLLQNAYQTNNDENVLSLGKKHGASISDEILDAGLHETLGNASMNLDNIDNAINNFKKANKLSSIGSMDSRFEIDIAVALIAKGDFSEASLILYEILNNQSITYSDKNKAEELLALANFNKDN